MSIKTGTLPSQQSILKTGRLLLAFLLTIMSDQASASSHIYRFFTEAEDLAKQLNRQQAIILDVRDINAYAKGHIPQAVSLPIRLTYNATGRTDRLASIDVLQKLLGNAGIDIQTHVVIYDDGSYKDAGRMFWVLEVVGLKHIKVLDGGLPSWKQQALPLSTAPYTPRNKNFIATIRPDRLATKFSTQLASQTGNTQIIDSRSSDEFSGKKSITARKGHIPLAKNVPWDKNYITGAYGITEIRPLNDLKNLYAFLNIKKPVITYCNKGKQSSFTYLILRELGYSVSHYDGSWYEWSNDTSLPVQTPKNP